MEELLKQLKPSDVSNISSSPKPKDIMLELRTMNNNYVNFFKLMMGEFEKLRTTDKEVITELRNVMENKHHEYDEKFHKLEEQVKELQKKDEEKEEKLLEMESRQRKLNIIISKIPEKPYHQRETRGNPRVNDETYSEIHEKVVKYFEDKLGILGARQMIFRNIHRLGKRDPKAKKARLVIVAFVCQPDVDVVLQAARDANDRDIQIRTDLPKKYNDIRNALLKIRADYRDLPGEQSIKCKLTYIKFKPTLFKLVNNREVKVEIELGDDGKYKEVVYVDAAT